MTFKTCRSEIRRATHCGNSAPELPGFFATMALSGSRRVRPRFPGRRSCQLHPPGSRLPHWAPAWLRCRAHYPGGANRRPCRLLPGPCGLARISGGPASAISLSRPAQPYCALRAASLLARLSPGLCHEASAWPVTRPSRSSASILTDNYLGGLLPPTGCPRRKGALRNASYPEATDRARIETDMFSLSARRLSPLRSSPSNATASTGRLARYP